MLNRMLLAGAAVVLAAATVAAQTTPITARKALMKRNGDQAKLGIAMIKGEAPFDLDKAKAIFATFIDAANKMPELLPENSKTGEKTAALPAIWENMADVKARFAKLGEDAKAAQSSVKDLDSFKAAFSNIGKNDCGACHEHYRRKET
jgi:cytochrome c556